MKVIITGATGFIGRSLVEELLENNYEVKVLVRTKGKVPQWEGRVQEVQGDILDYDSLEKAFKGLDGVFHLAGVISTLKKDEKFMYDINFVGSKNVFEAALKNNITNFLFLASIFALGTGTKDKPANEEIDYNLGNLDIAYFKAKRLGELESYEYLKRGLPIKYVYPTFCVGPGDIYISSQRLIVDFLNGKLPATIRGGYNAIDVRDTAKGLRLGYEKGKIGEKYLVGGENITYIDFLKRLGKLTGKNPPRLVTPKFLLKPTALIMEKVMKNPLVDWGTALMAGYHWYYDDSKARKELGHTSRSLDESINDAVSWFRDNGYIKK